MIAGQIAPESRVPEVDRAAGCGGHRVIGISAASVTPGVAAVVHARSGVHHARPRPATKAESTSLAPNAGSNAFLRELKLRGRTAGANEQRVEVAA